jgi:SAM-dependent methyltransferase
MTRPIIESVAASPTSPPFQSLPDDFCEKIRVYSGLRRDLLERLPTGLGRVLDLGCGAGELGASLVATGKATSVCGIDISQDSIRLASQRLEQAVVIDLDQHEVPFPPASFDSLLYADVLEHLKFPWDTVRSQRALLRPGGRLFCSLPNVGHFRVLLSLLCQRWEYRSEGIFDYTHLRFFTRSSLTAMFSKAGYRDVCVDSLYPPGTRARLFSLGTPARLRDLTVASWWLEATAPPTSNGSMP